MFVLANVLSGVAGVLHTVMQLAWFVLVARMVLSWVRPNPPVGLIRIAVETVYRLTDPVLVKARQWLPFLQVGALDLSPIAVFLALGLVDQVVTSSLLQAANAL